MPAGDRVPVGAVPAGQADRAPAGTTATALVEPVTPEAGQAARTREKRPIPWRTALAALGGLSVLLAFPGYDLVALAVLGPALLAVAVHGRRARSGAWLGLVTGLVLFVPLLSWSGIYVGPVPWLALATSQAAFFAALGTAGAVVSRLPWWPLWTAALWVAVEAARGRLPFGGFPWGRLGLSQTEGPLLSLAAYGGVPLVTFAVALTGTLMAAAVLRAGDSRAVTGRTATARTATARTATARTATARTASARTAARGVAAAVAAALAVPLVGALAWLPLPGASLTAGGPTATVALIQGNVPRAGLDFNAQRRAVLDNHVQRTRELAAAVEAGEQPQPDLVIWPENSSDIDPYLNADAARQIDRAARAIGAPILVGAVVVGPGEFISNTAIVWDPATGPGDTYVKRHPVPFAEYIPYRSFFRVFSKEVDRVRRDFIAGDEVGVLDVGGVAVGDLICFEVVYDDLARDVVRAGAGMLVVQTNNATFGYTDESAQQLALSRVRAVEHGRTVAIAATSGLSGVVAPDGTVVERTELFTPDVVVAEIAQRSSTTLATRVGAAPEWALTALAAAAVATAVLRGRRRR